MIVAYIVYMAVTVSDTTAFASGSSPANAISVEDGTEEVEIDLEKALEVNSAVAVEKEIAADTLVARVLPSTPSRPRAEWLGISTGS